MKVDRHSIAVEILWGFHVYGNSYIKGLQMFICYCCHMTWFVVILLSCDLPCDLYCSRSTFDLFPLSCDHVLMPFSAVTGQSHRYVCSPSVCIMWPLSPLPVTSICWPVTSICWFVTLTYDELIDLFQSNYNQFTIWSDYNRTLIMFCILFEKSFLCIYEIFKFRVHILYSW